MKKLFPFVVFGLLLGSLAPGFFLSPINHALCASLEHHPEPEQCIIPDSGKAVATGEEEETATVLPAASADEQEQGMTLPNRMLHIVDQFAKLVMVI